MRHGETLEAYVARMTARGLCAEHKESFKRGEDGHGYCESCVLRERREAATTEALARFREVGG
jgi:hypothetical protein